MSAESPLAGAIDRALTEHSPASTALVVKIRDAILAEIEAEFGPLTVERTRLSADYHGRFPVQVRLVSERKAEQ